jgi:hypothetical protein
LFGAYFSKRRILAVALVVAGGRNADGQNHREGLMRRF